MSSQSAVGAQVATHKWVIPRLSLMMFLEFFVWGPGTSPWGS